MKILYCLFKIWATSFILFIFISFIVPSKRPFADGEVYINSKIYKHPIITTKPHLITEQMESCKDILSKVDHWRHQQGHRLVNKIVFVIPRYEVLIYYFYLKQQNVLDQKQYQVSSTSEVFDLKRIFLKYQETIGVLLEYCIEFLVQQKNKIVEKTNKST